MKFSVSLSDFQELLQKTLPAIPPKSTLPVLEHLHFSIIENQLQVIATDQDITIMSKLAVVGLEDGSVLVPGRRLNDIIKLLGHSGDITFSSDPEKFDIKLKTNTGQYSMKGLNPVEYLDIPELFESEKSVDDIANDEAASKIMIDKIDMIRLASKTVFAVSNDEFRPAMTGVLFQFRGSKVTSVATDSYRLCRAIAFSEEEVFPEDLDIILPARAVDLLKKVDQDVEMSIIEAGEKITHLRFDIGTTVFITRIIDEKFPPYESVIPENNQFVAVVDKKELLAAIKRVSVFTSTLSKQVKIRFNESGLYITGHDEESGTDGDELVNADYNGEEVEVGFNYQYLEQAVQNIDTDDVDSHILITLSEPTRPVLVKSRVETEELLMLIMPVRIAK